ncbi:MAG: matrixin family metalloprotease [Myxococcota bacterium]
MFQGFQRAWLGCSALLALAWASPAAAYCRTTTCSIQPAPSECGDGQMLRDPTTGCLMRGRPLYWAPRCISLSVQKDGSPRLGLDYAHAESIVTGAFGRWPAAQCEGGSPSIELYSLGPISCDQREHNSNGPNANAILFRDEAWDYDLNAIALTTVRFKPASGEIRGADMEINTYGFDLSQQSLSYVVTHEAGHFLGLDHTPRQDAVMFAEYSIQPDSNSSGDPQLSDDDLAGICAIYPPNRAVPAQCDPEPDMGFASDCGGDVIASCGYASARVTTHRSPWLLLGLFGAGCAWRRRKARAAD